MNKRERHRQMKNILLLIASAAILISCTTTNFTPYEGSQNWPMSQGAMVDRKYSLPVYYGYPPRPYKVVGMLELGNATAGSEVGGAANKAKDMGADAIIVLSHGVSQVGSYTFGSATAYGTGYSAHAYGSSFTMPVMAGSAKVMVIRWS
jgi:hypothetical protein